MVGHPGTRTTTMQGPLRTKQVGSVPAFGDGKGAATITSSQPLQEPKPTAISTSVGDRITTMSTKYTGLGGATIAPSPFVVPKSAEFSHPLAKRNAWVENATPAKVVPLSTPTTMAQIHKPRDIYSRSVTLQNGDVSIQTAPPEPKSTTGFDPVLVPAPTETVDTRVIPAEISGTIGPVSTLNHTLSNFGTHCRNDTEHRTHRRTNHNFNHTKTIIEELTKTKEVTKTITYFPQLRTHNSSRPVTIPGSVPTLDSAYTQMTYHHENAVQPTQSAIYGSFQSAIPEISHQPVSSQAFQAASPPSIAILVYGFIVAAMLISAYAQWVHYIVTGEVEDEPLEEELNKDTVAKIKSWVHIEEKQDREALARIKARAESKTRAVYEKKLAEKEYEESKRVSAEYKRERELTDKDWEESEKKIAKDLEERIKETPKYSTRNMDPIAAYVSISTAAQKIQAERQQAVSGAYMEEQGEKLREKEAKEVKEALRRRVTYALDAQVDPMD